MEDSELIMIGKGGRPLRSCDFPAGIVFYGGGKEDELWHPPKDMIPQPRSRALSHGYSMRFKSALNRI